MKKAVAVLGIVFFMLFIVFSAYTVYIDYQVTSLRNNPLNTSSH